MHTSGFWSYISEMSVRMHESAPEGHAAIVEIRLRSGETYRPEVVQIYEPCLIFEVDDNERRKVVVVYPSDVEKVECRFEASTRAPVGFRVGDVTGTA